MKNRALSINTFIGGVRIGNELGQKARGGSRIEEFLEFLGLAPVQIAGCFRSSPAFNYHNMRLVRPQMGVISDLTGTWPPQHFLRSEVLINSTLSLVSDRSIRK